MALPPSLRCPGARAFFSLAPPPACWALGLPLLTLSALAFCQRGIDMGSHAINDGMKIDIRVDKSREVLELLWGGLLRQHVTHTTDLALYHLRGRHRGEGLQTLAQEWDQGEISGSHSENTDRRRLCRPR